MDSNSKQVFIWFLFIVACGCETIVDIDIPVDQSQVVMNSLVNPDSAWSVRLTFSEHVLEKDRIRFIDDAEVNIFDANDQVVTTLEYDSRGYYRSALSPPEAGKYYKIVAKVPGYIEVEGSTAVPALPNILAATSRFSIFNYKPEGLYTVDFEDDPFAANYYEVFIENVERKYYSPDSSALEYWQQYIESDDPSIKSEILDFETGIMFRDKLFSGKNINLSLKTPAGSYGLSSGGAGTRVLVRSVTQEYYDYATTLKLQFKISSDPLAQPVEVKSNIKNGLGLVAGVAQSSYFVARKTPVITSFSPTEGKPGDVITIIGENLYGDYSGTEVWLYTNTEGYFIGNTNEGRVRAQIVERTPSKLTIVIPTGSKTNPIILSAFGTLTFSKDKFTVLE